MHNCLSICRLTVVLKVYDKKRNKINFLNVTFSPSRTVTVEARKCNDGRVNAEQACQ